MTILTKDICIFNNTVNNTPRRLVDRPENINQIFKIDVFYT